MSIEQAIADLHQELRTIRQSVVQIQESLDAHPLQSLPATPSDKSPHGEDKPTQRYLERLDEYKFLRVELDKIWEQTYTTMNFMFSAIGVMIGAGLWKEGGALVLLPGASLVTLGGYRLIRIHTTRVWRIVGYMRCALEKNLEGIRWETRLAERNKVLGQSRDPDLDRDIFDGHVLILDLVNIVIICILLLIGLSAFAPDHISISPNRVTDMRHDFRFWTLITLSLAVSSAILGWSIKTKQKFKRGGVIEEAHLNSWKAINKKCQRVAEMEAPDLIDEII